MLSLPTQYAILITKDDADVPINQLWHAIDKDDAIITAALMQKELAELMRNDTHVKVLDLYHCFVIG